MSYRTKVNGVQVFGNNESYPEWIEFIKAQGIEVDGDSWYKGEITDFMGALEVIEKIVMRLEAERQTRIQSLNEMVEKFREKEKDETVINKFISMHRGTTGLFDFSHIFKETQDIRTDDNYNMSLFDRLEQLLDEGYIFMPHVFYEACKPDLEQQHPFSIKNHLCCYKLKAGATIKVSAG